MNIGKNLNNQIKIDVINIITNYGFSVIYGSITTINYIKLRNKIIIPLERITNYNYEYR